MKRYLISSIAKLIHELPLELLNDLRLRILGNLEILEKFQICVETEPSFKKLNFDKSSQKRSFQPNAQASEYTSVIWQNMRPMAVYSICFISNTFISYVRIKLAKAQANAKQKPEAELLLFDNYSHSSSTLSSKNNRGSCWKVFLRSIKLKSFPIFLG